MSKDILIEELREIMEEKNLSANATAPYLESSPKQVIRWLNYEHVPTRIFKKAIQRGIKKMRNLP